MHKLDTETVKNTTAWETKDEIQKNMGTAGSQNGSGPKSRCERKFYLQYMKQILGMRT